MTGCGSSSVGWILQTAEVQQMVLNQLVAEQPVHA